MTIKGIGSGAREVFLTFGALLGVLCIVATIAGVAFGVKPLVFRSGSMSPAIHTGDLAVSRTVDASDLKVGDIVSVVNSEGNRVTHRLVNVASQGDARQLTLKGDDNKVADTEVYTVTRAERVLFDIPKAGYVVNAAASPVGVFVLGAYVTLMLLLVFRRKRPTDRDGQSPPRRKGGARKANTKGARVTPRMIATTAFAASIAVATPAVATPWTNDVVIDGGTFTAKVVPAPVASCGPLGLLSVRFNWTAVAGATGYVLHYGAGGATTETVGAGTTTKLLTAALAGGTFYVQTQINYGSTIWTSANSNSLNYTVAVLSFCG